MSVGDLKNQFVNAVRVSAFLYQSVFQLYKAMYYQLLLVVIQIYVVGFISHSLILLIIIV